MRLRFLTAIFGVLAVAGCGGGSTSTVPSFSPTPTAVPSAPVTPTPTPTPLPTSLPTPSSASYTYAGTMAQTVQTSFSNPAPQPSGTPVASGTVTSMWTSAQTVTVAPTSGPAGTYDTHVVDTETGASPSPVTVTQTTSDTISTVPAGGAGNVLVTATTSLSNTPGAAATFADQFVTTFGSGRIVNVLPESTGASWSNTDARVATDNAPGGNVTTRTVQTNGTYVQTTVTPPLSVPAPSPVPTLFAFQENADGSGTFNTVSSGTTISTYQFTFSAPPIQIAYSSNGSAPTPYATPATWWTAPLTLYAETDVASTGVPIPSACSVPSSFGTTARQIAQRWTRVDTIYGTIETQALVVYDSPGIGTLCQTINDTLLYYYDYTSGNYNPTPYDGAPLFYNGVTPWKTVATSQTLGLRSTTAPLSGLRAPASLSPQMLARPGSVAVDRAVAALRSAQTRDLLGALTHGGRQ